MALEVVGGALILHTPQPPKRGRVRRGGFVRLSPKAPGSPDSQPLMCPPPPASRVTPQSREVELAGKTALVLFL